jgi:hypothetical protein
MVSVIEIATPATEFVTGYPDRSARGVVGGLVEVYPVAVQVEIRRQPEVVARVSHVVAGRVLRGDAFRDLIKVDF